jgi:hypothetical protein
VKKGNNCIYHYANKHQNGSELLPQVEVLLTTNLSFSNDDLLPSKVKNDFWIRVKPETRMTSLQEGNSSTFQQQIPTRNGKFHYHLINEINYYLKNVSFSILTIRSSRLPDLSIKSTLAAVAGICN